MVRIGQGEAKKITLNLVLFFLMALFFYAIKVNAGLQGIGGDAELYIYDEIESSEQHLTYCASECSLKSKSNYGIYDVIFYSNFTNSSGSIINASNGNGGCYIKFNQNGIYGSFSDMNYNYTNLRFEFNRSFNYKGLLNYTVNCTSDYGNITLEDNFTIYNTEPLIFKTGAGYVDIDNDDIIDDYLICQEDYLCIYNFSANVSEDDFNDVLIFNYSTANTTLGNFSINSSTGILYVSQNHSNNTGLKNIELKVRDSESADVSGILRVNISEVNDIPYFINLSDVEKNSSEQFYLRVNISDEEGDVPINISVNFTGCYVAEWSTRNCSTDTGRALFNASNSSQFYKGVSNSSDLFFNISFFPNRNDVGNYTLNFSLVDNRGASYSQEINISILNVNQLPYFRYVCDNERNTTEGQQFSCIINVSDIDETSNLTISSEILENEASEFFLFNNSDSSDFRYVNLATSYNASFLVNFTTDDFDVGNWTVRINIYDSVDTADSNSTEFNFVVYNVNDSVSIDSLTLPNPLYNSNNYTYYINATDEDLNIPQESFYNENLTFYSNLSWVIIEDVDEYEGYSRAQIYIESSGVSSGVYYVNLSVSDYGNYSSDSTVVMINITGNTPPEWNSAFALNTTYVINEGDSFYLNLSANVSDIDEDNITFSYTINDVSNTSFYAFEAGFNNSTGVISFIPDDFEVGYHNVTIYAKDVGKDSQTPLNFIFIVDNQPDTPIIKTVSCITPNQCNPNTISDILYTMEDNQSTLRIYVEDNDFSINQSQRAAFYQESLSLNLTIRGPNPNLFNFTLGFISGNTSMYTSNLAPNKSDVGEYNITINISDVANLSSVFRFNLTISENQHPPIIDDIPDFTLSILENLSYDANSTDAEDGNDNNINFTYSLINLTGQNFLSLNVTHGIFNISNLSGHAGIWNYTLLVNDSSGRSDSDNFTITVFDYPVVTTNQTYFNLTENLSFIFNFTGNHSVGNELSYILYINGQYFNSTTERGDGAFFLWTSTPNLTSETTCLGNGSRIVNLTLNVSNEKLTSSYNWDLTVAHTNSPIEFLSDIGSGNSIKTLASSFVDFSDHFFDLDASDGCNNQSIGFQAINMTSTILTNTIINWTNGTPGNITFSGTSVANYSIIAFEYNDSIFNVSLGNVTSNNFTVEIEVVTEVVTTPSSGGGGGSSTPKTDYKPISLKIILPDPISASKKEKIVVPVSIFNDGTFILSNISLSTNVVINNSLAEDVSSSLSIDYIESLDTNETVNMTLTADINTEIEGVYEINIFANVSNPKYYDWGKIYLTVKEGTTFEDKILFTEELIVSNPECAEIQEIVDEAKEDYSNGNVDEAERKIELAINSCKQAITQQPKPVINKIIGSWGISNYLLAFGVLSAAIGFLYYFYKRFNLSRSVSLDIKDK